MRANAESQTPATEQEGQQPLGEVLAAAATELQHAYERGLLLETAILDMIKNSASAGPATHELQHLDLVLQHVHAVSDFLGELARAGGNLGAVSVTEALGRVKLADVRDRLAGAANEPKDIDDDILWG